MKVHRWELKYLFRRAVRELLPEETVKRGKSGFNLPIARWLRGELRDLTHDALAPTALERTGLLDGRLVAGMLEEHESGRADRSRELWTLLTLALWYDRVANQAAGPPGAFPLRSAEPAAEVGS
jgi:asparagine synthase (glutamine-hydrolysing)